MSRGVASRGFGIVEVLVGLAVLALMLTSLVALQAANLRAVREAGSTRRLATAAESEARLRSLLDDPGPSCLVATRWPEVSACGVVPSCAGPVCAVTLEELTVTGRNGREVVLLAARLAARTGEAPP